MVTRGFSGFSKFSAFSGFSRFSEVFEISGILKTRTEETERPLIRTSERLPQGKESGRVGEDTPGAGRSPAEEKRETKPEEAVELKVEEEAAARDEGCDSTM